MNYAYVPPTGDAEYDKAARMIEALRPDTTVLSSPANLADFLQTTDGLSISFPADDLLLHAHGDSEGELFISVDSNTAPTTYEDLQRVNKSKQINIPPHVLKPTTKFRMVSCLIGTDSCLPYLRLLMQALGNPQRVSAPRFIHTYVSLDGKNVFEFMKYVFRLMSKTLPSRDEIVKKFKAAGNSSDPQFRYIDGSKIPDANWEQWVPAASAVNSRTYKTDFPVTLAGPLLPTTFEAEWKLSTDWYTSDPVIFLGSKPPPSESEALAQLADALGGGNLDSSHPFPVYKRYHHDSLSEFIASWMWRANGANGKFTIVTYVGSRSRYEIWVPITKPGTNELIYNYFPESGAPTINFDESNQPFKLFGVV